MGIAMIKLFGPSPLGNWFRRVRLGVVLSGLALGMILGCGGSSKGSAPTITAIAPTYGPYGTAVTVTGTGFSNGLKNFYFDGVAVTAGTYGSDTSVVVDVPAAAVTGPISAVNNGGTASYAEEFVVIPSLASTSPIGPTSGVAGSTTVTISGYGLMGITSVFITGDQTAITLSTQTANQITFQIPTSATVAANDTITLNNAYAAYGATPFTFQFDVTGSTASTSTPTITTISPTSGPFGTAVTVTGSGFSNGFENVSFGGVPATTSTVNSDTSLTAAVPAAAVTGNIIVTTTGGSSAPSSSIFLVTPTYVSYSPNTGAAGTQVTVTGSGLEGISSVSIVGPSPSTASTAILFSTPSATQLTFSIPATITVPGSYSILITPNPALYGPDPIAADISFTVN